MMNELLKLRAICLDRIAYCDESISRYPHSSLLSSRIGQKAAYVRTVQTIDVMLRKVTV